MHLPPVSWESRRVDQGLTNSLTPLSCKGNSGVAAQWKRHQSAHTLCIQLVPLAMYTHLKIKPPFEE